MLLDFITLGEQGFLHMCHTHQGIDFGPQNNGIVGFDQKVIAPRIQASSEGRGVIEHGQKDDGHKALAHFLLNNRGRLTASFFGH